MNQECRENLYDGQDARLDMLALIKSEILLKGDQGESVSEQALLDAFYNTGDNGGGLFPFESTKQLANKAEFNLLAGNRFNVSSFGSLSAAIISCKDVETVLRLLEKYSTLVLPIIKLILKIDDEHMLMQIEVLSSEPKLEQVIVEAYIDRSVSK